MRVIVPIVHENVAGLLVNGDTMYVAEIAGRVSRGSLSPSSARAAFNAPLHEEFSVLVKLGDAGSRVGHRRRRKCHQGASRYSVGRLK